MKKIVFGALITLLLLSCHRTHKADRETANQKDNNEEISSSQGLKTKLVDSLTKNYFILDSEHVIVTAYDRNGKIIWKTDPHKDNGIEEYRTEKAIIVYFNFESNNWCSGKTKVISIGYNNSQFGYLDLKTGAFHFCGQD